MGVKERKAMEREQRRNQILDAARYLLFHSGIKNISMSKIAGQAELGVGTIYFYYQNKEEIFVALQEEGLSLLHDQIVTISNKRISQKKKLIQAAKAYCRFSVEHKNYFDIINYFLSSSTVFFKPDLKNRIDQSGYKILSVIRKIVEKGIEKGQFKQTDSEKYTILFWATIHGVLQTRKMEATLLKDNGFDGLFEYSVNQLIHTLTQQG